MHRFLSVCLSITGSKFGALLELVPHFLVHFIFDLEVKGHMGLGQRSHWSRSNKDPKQRQVGSQQRQVAFFLTCNTCSSGKNDGGHMWTHVLTFLEKFASVILSCP